MDCWLDWARVWKPNSRSRGNDSLFQDMPVFSLEISFNYPFKASKNAVHKLHISCSCFTVHLTWISHVLPVIHWLCLSLVLQGTPFPHHHLTLQQTNKQRESDALELIANLKAINSAIPSSEDSCELSSSLCKSVDSFSAALYIFISSSMGISPWGRNIWKHLSPLGTVSSQSKRLLLSTNSPSDSGNSLAIIIYYRLMSCHYRQEPLTCKSQNANGFYSSSLFWPCKAKPKVKEKSSGKLQVATTLYTVHKRY